MTEGLPYIEIIPNSGACIASANILTGAGTIKYLVRETAKAPADNGWRVFSDIDTDEYLSHSENMQIVAFNQLCVLEPALISIYDFPVGSDLQLVDTGKYILIIDNHTGTPINPDDFYVPGNPVRNWGPDTPQPFRETTR